MFSAVCIPPMSNLFLKSYILEVVFEVMLIFQVAIIFEVIFIFEIVLLF